MDLALSNSSNEYLEDRRLLKAVELFNACNWYLAHDLFEELWHETSGRERITLQAFLQVSVAQVHLDRGNTVGATILYGEGLGRLKQKTIPNFGLDIVRLCKLVEARLNLLQQKKDPDICELPFLFKK